MLFQFKENVYFCKRLNTEKGWTV